MDEILERVENNFINIYNKFDILDKKLNDYHMKFDKINEIIDLIISDEYTKIYKTYYPMKNYDLMQDRFFIYNAVIDIPLKANTFIIFEYVFNSEYINIPLFCGVLHNCGSSRHFAMCCTLKKFARCSSSVFIFFSFKWHCKLLIITLLIKISY